MRIPRFKFFIVFVDICGIYCILSYFIKLSPLASLQMLACLLFLVARCFVHPLHWIPFCWEMQSNQIYLLVTNANQNEFTSHTRKIKPMLLWHIALYLIQDSSKPTLKFSFVLAPTFRVIWNCFCVPSELFWTKFYSTVWQYLYHVYSIHANFPAFVKTFITLLCCSFKLLICTLTAI